mmetsp:Transcript_11296/g.19016  ORF Transcript_11296/g.19016 Transcript_11296/m.19016 type:complete len:89 (+) Transcript_11296:211-477(+)
MNFDKDDEFVNYEKKRFRNSLIQLESSEDAFPGPVPIGVAMAEVSKRVFISRNDEDEADEKETLDSIKLAEDISGHKMEMPSASAQSM